MVAELENPPLRLRKLDPVNHGGCHYAASERRHYDTASGATNVQNGEDSTKKDDALALSGRC